MAGDVVEEALRVAEAEVEAWVALGAGVVDRPLCRETAT